MNSLGVEPFVNNIFADLRDGRVLLQVIEKISPGTVEPGRVNVKAGLSRFQAIENTNYVVTCARRMQLSLVGLQGADLTDGHVTLTLGLVWQLMRAHVTKTLRSIKKGDAAIGDAELIEWANARVAEASTSFLTSDEPMAIGSFKDVAGLRSGRYLLTLLEALKPGTVDRALVCLGADEDLDYKSNAKYAISVARKLGATLFLLPEDIVQVKPKMLLTFIGSLMALQGALTNSRQAGAP